MTITIRAGPRNARTDPETGLRYYRWQGRELPSVTTIRRMAGLPHGLHQWAINQVISWALDNWSIITDRLSSGELALVRHELRGAATAERDRAAALGTAVHDAAAEGRDLTEVDPLIAPRLRQYLDWQDTSNIEILASEFQIWNLTQGYAGTVDLLGRFPNSEVWLIDLKTGKGLYGEHALQLMPYMMAEFSGEDDVIDERVTALLHEVAGIALLHFTEDHWEFHGIRADRPTWDAFRGLLMFATWMADHSRIEDISLFSRRGGNGVDPVTVFERFREP